MAKKLKQVFNRKTKKWHIMEERPGHVGGLCFIKVQDERHETAEDITGEMIKKEMINPNGGQLPKGTPIFNPDTNTDEPAEPDQDQDQDAEPAGDQDQDQDEGPIGHKWPWE